MSSNQALSVILRPSTSYQRVSLKRVSIEEILATSRVPNEDYVSCELKKTTHRVFLAGEVLQNKDLLAIFSTQKWV